MNYLDSPGTSKIGKETDSHHTATTPSGPCIQDSQSQQPLHRTLQPFQPSEPLQLHNVSFDEFPFKLLDTAVKKSDYISDFCFLAHCILPFYHIKETFFFCFSL